MVGLTLIVGVPGSRGLLPNVVRLDMRQPAGDIYLQRDSELEVKYLKGTRDEVVQIFTFPEPAKLREGARA